MVLARYLYGDRIDQLIARYQPGEGTAWYLTDHLGTVRDLVDSDGDLINTIVYDAFGNILSQTDALAGDRFTYTGREYDTETGLYYYRARYYDPALGRFISQDPIGFSAGDANLYRYVGNRVDVFIDPSGLDWLDASANFSSGWADALSFGATSAVRSAFGIDGGIDYDGSAYRTGEVVGTVHSAAIGAGGAVGAVKTAKAAAQGAKAAAGATGRGAAAGAAAGAAVGGAKAAAGPAKSGIGKLIDAAKDFLDRLDGFSDAAESAAKAIRKLADGNITGALQQGFNALSGLGLPGKGKGGKPSNELGTKSGKGGVNKPDPPATPTKPSGNDAASRSSNTTPDPYKRPSGYRKGVREETWESAKDSDGIVRDPLTGNEMSPDEPWDMGHKPGYEFHKHKKSAEDRGVSRKEFLDEHNTTSHYQPELPSSNRGHGGESGPGHYLGY